MPHTSYTCLEKFQSICTVAHNCHIKYKLLTSTSNYSHQIQITHIKYKILTSNTNYSHQIQITHIKYKLLTSNTNYSHQISKTRLNGQRSQNENYVQFPLDLDPTTILFLHVVLSSGCFAAPSEEMSTIVTFVATTGKVS